MVGMAITFGNCDMQTPHGGPPFHYWKQGFGFGHGKGPGTGNVLHPAAAQQMRFTPNGDRALASSPFWRRKSEVGPAAGFGIGERPDYGRQNQSVTIGPDNYGDVSRCLDKTKANVTRAGIKLKPRFPSMEERYRDLAGPSSGPGPAKYNTEIPTGQSSWSNPAKSCSYSMGVRSLSQSDLREMMARPSPTDYNVRGKAGKNSPIVHGSLYDISLHGKIRRFGVGEASPGPAKYNVKGQLDEYGLGAKIANVKGPPPEYWRDAGSPVAGNATTRSPLAASAEASRTLSRVESSPA